MAHVLVSAYACEPGRGSEAAVGWNWVTHLASRHDLTVVTRANNRPAIEAAQDGGIADVTFLYYDLPPALRFWKRGSRGMRAYYVLWQYGAYRLARREHARRSFDLVHHVTFVNYWLPTFMPRLGLPFIWGPVGGGESTPRQLHSGLTWRGRVIERLRDLARSASVLNPFVREAARRAAAAFATTPETADRLRALGAANVRVMSQVGLPADERRYLATRAQRRPLPLRYVAAGALLYLKGYDLAIEAFARVMRGPPESEFWVFGDGPERKRLRKLAVRLGVAQAVRFFGRVPRGRAMDGLRDCDIFVHPGLHDSGGYACAEAMAAGLPVICLDIGGPAYLVSPQCGVKVVAATRDDTVAALATAMALLRDDPDLRAAMSAAALSRAADVLDWDAKARTMDQHYSWALNREAALV